MVYSAVIIAIQNVPRVLNICLFQISRFHQLARITKSNAWAPHLFGCSMKLKHYISRFTDFIYREKREVVSAWSSMVSAKWHGGNSVSSSTVTSRPPSPPPTRTRTWTRGYLKLPMLVPHHLNPPILGKDIPPISGIGYHWQLQKHPLFWAYSWNLTKTTAKKYPLFLEKGNMHAAPLCIRVGGGGGQG